jgi:flagellar motor switch protein FliM
MTQQIQIAEVEIVADLGTTRVTLGDILNMKTGDIIPLNIRKWSLPRLMAPR